MCDISAVPLKKAADCPSAIRRFGITEGEAVRDSASRTGCAKCNNRGEKIYIYILIYIYMYTYIGRYWRVMVVMLMLVGCRVVVRD